ncbi:hypothetical protein JXC34_00285 [Candidatus Woesearchaeota archaeon]|nr:hypothetical protein [Candidatus Woesearchaeota archaeon]
MGKMGNKWYFLNVILFFAILIILAMEMIYVLKSYYIFQLAIIIILAVLEMLYIFDHARFHYLSLTFFIVVLARSLVIVFVNATIWSIVVPILGFIGLFVSLEELNLKLRSERTTEVRMKQKALDYPVMDAPKEVFPIKRKAERALAAKVKKAPAKRISKSVIKKTAAKGTTITASRYAGKIIGDRKTGLAHMHDCTFAKKILKKDAEIFNSERDAMKKYRPHKCLLP